VGETPLAALDFILFGTGDFQQMADRRRQHIVVGLVVIGRLFEAAQRLGNIQGNGGLLGNNQGFGHRERLLNSA